MKYLEGTPLQESYVALSAQGLPKSFSPSIVSAINGDSFDDLKIIFTILNSTRALSFGKEVDVSTITNPLNKGESYDSLVNDMSRYTVLFWKATGQQ